MYTYKIILRGNMRNKFTRIMKKILSSINNYAVNGGEPQGVMAQYEHVNVWRLYTCVKQFCEGKRT